MHFTQKSWQLHRQVEVGAWDVQGLLVLAQPAPRKIKSTPCSHQLPGTFHTDIPVENNKGGGG